jgi:hypothetical protein
MGPLGADRQAAEVRSPFLGVAMATTKSSTVRVRARRLGMERLESRTVLSADLGAGASFDLAIQGTDIQFSEMGLPAAMGGDVYLSKGGAASNARIGRYEETLTPILMDVTGDQIPEFVGTHGVATFTFFVGAPRFEFGSITTTNVSFIQGVTPAGELVVGSQGTIVQSTRMLRGLAGGFVSQSTVGLAPSFEMATSVHFTVNREVGPMFAFLAIANDLVSKADSADCQQKGGVIETTASERGRKASQGHRNGPDARTEQRQNVREQRRDSKHDVSSARQHARDRAFADNVDWRMDRLIQDLS